MTEPEPIAAKLERIGSVVADRSSRRLVPAEDDDPNPEARTLDEVRQTRWVLSMPSRFQWAKLDDLPPGPRAPLTEWAVNPMGRNLLLFGSVGSGKSHAAVAACRRSFFCGLDVMFCPVVEMLDDLKPGGPDGYLGDLMGVDRLILDDLGQERPTDWTADRLYALVNRRWLEERPTVATTNLSPEALEASVGTRMFSRLAGNAVTVMVTGPDRRVP